MKTKPIRAWHFVSSTLRDGRPIPKDGVWLKCPDKLVICETGLHASRHPFDALQFAPGNTLCLVDCAGEVIEREDKLVCSDRRIVARMDAAEMLRYFARMQALSVVDQWGAPDVVLDFLMIGEDSRAANAACAATYATYAAARAANAANAAANAAACAATYAAYAAANAAANAAAYAATYAAANAAACAATYAAYADAAAREYFQALVVECFEGVI